MRIVRACDTTEGHPRLLVKRVKDGRTWRIGTDADVAWIANGTSPGPARACTQGRQMPAATARLFNWKFTASDAGRCACTAPVWLVHSSLHHDDLMYPGIMRTTLEIPDDLHAQAVAIARDRHQSLSQTVAALMRRGLGSGFPGEVAASPRTGLPVVHVGRTITTEDVRRLEDDDS